ncbi:MAG: DUF805 domain-containing protein [Treponema sp.]|jgi:uncharacterized membrane protein YhaH (DUF805 family)|nr:DUF805 domain-containing protein [Treponema sp.]
MAEKKSNSGTTVKKNGIEAGIAAKLEPFSRALAKRKKSAGSGGIELFGIEILENFIEVIKKYTVIEGRARRREFWMFALASFIIGVIFAILAVIPILGIIFSIASSLFYLATIVPGFTVGVRRLHDRDKSGWFILLMLIPLVGGIILLVWCAMEGTSGRNKYGPDPKDGRR